MSNPVIGSDVERLTTIHQLEQAIAVRLPILQAASTDRDAIKRELGNKHQAVVSLSKQAAGINQQVLRKSGGVYLNAGTLDRGTLFLGHEALWFKGWHGQIRIDFAKIQDVELSTSRLPARAGIPFLETRMPGPERTAPGLILTVTPSETNSALGLVVIADVADGDVWFKTLTERSTALQNAARLRQDLAAKHTSASAQADEISGRLAIAEARVKEIESEIAPLRNQMAKLKSEQAAIDRARASAAVSEMTKASKRKSPRRKR